MFFILGRGRSGTDLLSTVLNAHPDISVPPEALFIMNLYHRFYETGEWSLKIKRQFTRCLWDEARLTKWWNIDKEKVVEDILSQDANADFAGLCRIPYRQYAGQQGKSPLLLGDKNPTYTLFVKELHEIYPDAKFIHVVRDYRDNALSFKNVSFDLKNIFSLAERWRVYNLVVRRFAEQHPALVLTIRYEDFLGQPDQVLSRVCQFLGVECDSEFLNFHQKQSGGDVWQKNLSRPIDPGQKGKWRTQLRKRDIARVEYVCGESGRHYNYEPLHESFPLSTKILSLGGVLVGKVANFLEANFFKLPYRLRVFLLNRYRKMTLTDTTRP